MFARRVLPLLLALPLAACDRPSVPIAGAAPTASQTASEATVKPAQNAAATTAQRREIPEAFSHVLLVSVDGLRPECLEPPLLAQFPNFARLLSGPHTLEARTDPDYTVTLPNHLTMLTGRPVVGAAGHGWISNSDPPGQAQGGTLHAQKRSYVASVFDVAHDHGVSTTMVVTKTKFALLTQSYGDSTGAPDTVGKDDGKQKIDRSFYSRKTADLGPIVADELARCKGPSFLFVHLGEPDFVGHAKGWDLNPGSPYLAAVGEVDGALGTILDAIETNQRLRDGTAIVLTADHGGGVPFKSHTDRTSPLNFRIPFLVWYAGGASADLRELNPHRARMNRDAQVDSTVQPQPIRNGDAGNLCLKLLGLPPIDGSLYGRTDALTVLAPAVPAASK